MTSLRLILLLLLAGVFGCSLEHYSVPAGTCGGDGRRCCPMDERAAAGAASNGCLADHVCAANTAMDAGTAPRQVCRRCPTGQIVCDNRCVNPLSDTSNCGRCGNVCRGGQICQPVMSSMTGTDGGVRDGGAGDGGTTGTAVCRQMCPAGQTFCDSIGSCVDTATDRNNCSGCGVVCPNSQACTASRCACGTGQTFCTGTGGGCVNLQDNITHCGMCGTACQPGQRCAAGRCECPIPGQIFCTGMGCIDPTTNRSHCGACGNACSTGQACVGGRCICDVMGRTFCSGSGCVNTATDNANCGACSVACPAGQSCVSGMCTCPPGQTSCAMLGCLNLQSDFNNCGRCGNACNPGQSCMRGVCVCPSGQSSCGTAGCANLTVDTNNCGVCGRVCPPGQFCSGSVCVCPSGLTRCGGATGSCVNVQSDNLNCGVCGTACDMAFPNAVGVCGTGRCVQTACRAGFGDCNMAAGCETATATDANNCGACLNRCAFANAAAACSAGVCRMGACNRGFTDCNGDATDGCETNIGTDVTNCGTCRNVCPATTGRTPTCTPNVTTGIGACGLGAMCMAPTADCNGMAGDGCEINTSTSAANCGACGRPCDSTNGTPTCAGGICARIDCGMNFGNCDGNVATGCEADFLSNVAHCGGCNNRCSFPNAAASCSAGSCRMGSCNAGFGNCDSATTNGCEVNTNTDSSNCGACGNVCAGGSRCVSGACVVVCPTGQTNCSGTCFNVTGNDNSHCGSCTTVCPSGQVCSAGACVCPTGQTNCSGSCFNLTNDNAHCGTCTTVCASGTRCSSSACVTSCPGGTTDCTSSGAGCVNTNTSLEHCGGCGMVCNSTRIANGTAFTCTGGGCRVTACTANFNVNSGGTACIPCGAFLQPVCTVLPACASGFTPNPLATPAFSTCTGCGTHTNPECVGQSPTCATGTMACMTGSYSSCFDLSITATQCGACGATCVGRPNSAGGCALSRCTCMTGFADCNTDRADGCEANLQTNAAHCGICGHTCAGAPNTTGVCTAGACVCSTGFFDCDGNRANGCESATTCT